MKNILIVDNNPGFIFWLGTLLVGQGYQPWPASSPSDAISVGGRKALARLDLLIVNASLPGVSQVIDHFRRAQAHLRVMAFGPQGNTLPGVNVWQPTPGLSDDSAKREWVRAVKHLAGKQNRAA
jgi:CheY-like chemotaxis protein